MKHKTVVTLFAFSSLVALSGVSAFGMAPDGIRAKVPFEFRVGSVTLPAGEYLITSESANDPELLELRNENGSPSVLIMAQPLYPNSGVSVKPELVFKRVGNLEYLTQIWDSAGEAGERVLEPALVNKSGHHKS